MNRECKECQFVGPYEPNAGTLKLRGFHGYICYVCYLKEQREWRQTPVGREAANEASRLSARRIRAKRTAPRDV